MVVGWILQLFIVVCVLDVTICLLIKYDLVVLSVISFICKMRMNRIDARLLYDIWIVL